MHNRINPYTDDLLQVRPSRLFMPEATLDRIEINQQRFTILLNVPPLSPNVNCSVVAETLEKKVAIVVIFRYRRVDFSSSSRRAFSRTITVVK